MYDRGLPPRAEGSADALTCAVVTPAGVLDCRWGVWLDWNENGTLDGVCMATNGVYAYEAR